MHKFQHIFQKLCNQGCIEKLVHQYQYITLPPTSHTSQIWVDEIEKPSTIIFNPISKIKEVIMWIFLYYLTKTCTSK